MRRRSSILELLLGAVPPERAGAGAAMNETVTELGGALGMAVMGSIGTAVYRAHLGPGTPAPARATLGGAVATAARQPGSAAAQLLDAAREAFTTSMNSVSIVGVALMAAAAIGAVLFLRAIPAAAEPGEQPVPAPAERS